jgi:plastocyanin
VRLVEGRTSLRRIASELLIMSILSRSTLARRAAVVVAAALIVLTLGVLTVACGGGSGGTTATTAGTDTTTGGAKTVQVIMSNRAYDPATVTIKVGDTVTWVNQDAPKHDVVADNGEFKSDLFDKGATFSFTFAKAGTYPYHCSIHPGMTGTIIVQ